MAYEALDNNGIRMGIKCFSPCYGYHKKGDFKKMLSSRLEEVFAESGVRVFDNDFYL